MKSFLKISKLIPLAFTLAFALTLTSCEDDDNPNNNNANLRASNPAFSLDLTLITNAELNEVQGDRFIAPEFTNGSIQGVYVRNTGIGFVAFEIAEPNHIPGDCNFPSVKDGVFLEYRCGNETSVYSAGTGEKIEGNGEFNLKGFRVREIKGQGNRTVALEIGG